MRDAPPWTAYAMCDVQVVSLGDKAAMLLPGEVAAKSQAEYRLMSTTYERVEGEWLVKLHQQKSIRQASRRGALGDPGTGGHVPALRPVAVRV